MIPEEIARAQRDLEAIERLSRHPDFTGYFLRRLNEIIARHEATILGPGFSEAGFVKAQAALHALYGVRGLLDSDAAGCRSVLGVEKES